ncbi:MAG TPA: DoxX family protein [Candidatus Binataceae bacterium]|nr:DoxX family protein [Candidatus Binataceae bacterium]
MRDLGALIGRILLVLIFVLSGIEKLGHISGTMAVMRAHHIPLVPVALALSILIELGCGLLVMIGLKARWAALLIFLWLIPVTLAFHVAGYLHAAGPMEATIQQIMVLKNISMMGGLLVLAGMGPGALSVDSASARRNGAAALKAA